MSGLAGSYGGQLADSVMGSLHSIMQSAFDRANQRQAAMLGLNNAVQNPMTTPNTSSDMNSVSTPMTNGGINPASPPRGHINASLVPGVGSGNNMQPGLGGFTPAPAAPSGQLERFSNTPNPVYQPPIQGGVQTTPRGDFQPVPGQVYTPANTQGMNSPGAGDFNIRPSGGGYNTDNVTPPPPPYHTGDLAAPQFPGHASDLTPPSMQTGTPMPVPGTAGSPTPSPGLGSGSMPSTMPSAPSSSGGPVAIPNPRAGMPAPVAASPAQSQPRSMPVPPWVYQQQNIQVPSNILRGNPNLAALAPNGTVDTSGALGPIWGPIAQGQLPGGLAGQMFQGTIDPRTGRPLGQGGGAPAGGNPAAGGINASLVPGVGGAVPSPGLGAGGPLGAVPGAGGPVPNPGLGGSSPLPGVAAPQIPNIGLAQQIINQVGMPGGGMPAMPAMPATGQPAPAQPGQAPPVAAQPRSARDILAGRMQQAGGTLPLQQPAGALPKTGIPGQAGGPPVSPVPPGGAPPAAPAAAPSQPGTQGTGGIVDPQGSVQGAPQGNGTPWSNMNQYDDLFTKYGNMYGVDPNALKAVMAVESGGVVPANGHGLMQVQGNWQGTGGYDINTNEGQIAVAAMILGGQVQGGQPGNLEANFRNLYFNAPVDSSGNGTTQDAYWNWIQSNLQGGGAAPAGGPLPKTAPPGSPADTGTPGTGSAGLPANTKDGTGYPKQATGYPQPQAAPDPAGGSPMAQGGPSPQLVNAIQPNGTIIGGFKDATDLPYYDYFNGHGGNSGEHPGIDIGPAPGTPQGAHLPVTTPVSGTVVCGGTGNGQGMDGSGCAAFQDTMYGGAGRVELQINDHESLIFGHMNTSAFQPGQQVNAGDAIGTMGGMNSDHTHVEARVWCSDGSYQIVDPSLMMGGYYDNYRC